MIPVTGLSSYDYIINSNLKTQAFRTVDLDNIGKFPHNN